MILHFFENGVILAISDENVTGKVTGKVAGKDFSKVFRKNTNQQEDVK